MYNVLTRIKLLVLLEVETMFSMKFVVYNKWTPKQSKGTHHFSSRGFTTFEDALRFIEEKEGSWLGEQMFCCKKEHDTEGTLDSLFNNYSISYYYFNVIECIGEKILHYLGEDYYEIVPINVDDKNNVPFMDYIIQRNKMFQNFLNETTKKIKEVEIKHAI